MTRDLPTLNEQNKRALERSILRGVDAEIQRVYIGALERAEAMLSRLLTIDPEDMTRAQRVKFLRSQNIIEQITGIVGQTVPEVRDLVEQAAMAGVDNSFLRSAWAIDQAAGVNLRWGQFDEAAVRAAVGIGDARALRVIMPEREAVKHAQVLKKAFVNYDRNQRMWIAREVSRGVIGGESIPRVRARLQTALGAAGGNAQLIARTETLRALSLGSQLAYDGAEDKGVLIRQVWTATLDDRTRPDHAQMDGAVMDRETRMFSAPWGQTEGPHRNGIAEQDINCRCDVRPEIEGLSPEVRRIRGEDIQPYQDFSTWAQRTGLTKNRFGQRYNFE